MLLLVFAFFLGSTVARNSDFWQHLATGRLISGGQYSFGSDPFSYTSAGRVWINHSWLADLLAYKLWEALGGIEFLLARGALVVVKALLITLMAGFMLAVRRRGQSLWLPVCCVALALYAMSPRMYLQPAVLSQLFLAITVFLLYRWREGAREFVAQAGAVESTSGKSWHYLVALPILFALWGNLDEWFLLGPLTVGLFLVGEVVQLYASPAGSKERVRPSDLAVLALAGVAGLAACVLSPYTIRGFTLPTDIWATFWARDLQADQWFQQYFYTGLGREYLANAGLSGWAYVALLGLGIASFVLVRDELRWWRLMVWLPFAAFSALGMARTIPFFAVVAGSITALNLQDFAVRQFGLEPSAQGRLKNLSIAGRLASLCIGVVLLGLAWPGYLHPSPDDPRRTRHVGWDVEADPTLADTANALHQLHEQGVLRDDSHGFNFNPDIANVCAWFCPEEKAFFDYRLQLYPEILTVYTQTKSALVPKTTSQPADSAQWQQVFSNPEHAIDHVIIHHPSRRMALSVIEGLWREPEEWTTLYVQGTAAIFGWDDPLKPGKVKSFQKHRFNVSKLAFGPVIPPSQGIPDVAIDPPEKANFWSWYVTGPPARSADIDQAATYEAYAAEAGRSTQSAMLRWSMTGMLAASVASDPLGAGDLIYGSTAFLNNALFSHVLAQGFPTAPPGPLMLAVRAARRAVAQSPSNPDGYLALAQAYKALWFIRERSWANPGAPLLASFRRAAIMSAYQTALALDPDEPQVHRALAEMYQDMRYADLEMDELNEWIRTLKLRGSAGHSTAVDASPIAQDPQEYLKQREQTTRIQARRDDYELHAANKSPRQKAELAFERGLMKEAIDVLETADPAQLRQPEDGLRLAELKIEIGKGDEVAKQDFPLNDHQRALLAFAAGNYRVAASCSRNQAAGESSPPWGVS